MPQDPSEIDEDVDVDDLDDNEEQAAYNLFEGADGEPQVVRMWCTREQMRALSLHTMDTVKSGRPDAKQNGRIIFYWA